MQGASTSRPCPGPPRTSGAGRSAEWQRLAERDDRPARAERRSSVVRGARAHPDAEVGVLRARDGTTLPKSARNPSTASNTSRRTAMFSLHTLRTGERSRQAGVRQAHHPRELVREPCGRSRPLRLNLAPGAHDQRVLEGLEQPSEPPGRACASSSRNARNGVLAWLAPESAVSGGPARVFIFHQYRPGSSRESRSYRRGL